MEKIFEEERKEKEENELCDKDCEVQGDYFGGVFNSKSSNFFFYFSLMFIALILSLLSYQYFNLKGIGRYMRFK